MFGTQSQNTTFGRPLSLFGNSTSTTAAAVNHNPNKDIEVSHAPNDTVQALKFNPANPNVGILLASGSWDNNIRLWQVTPQGTTEPKAEQNVNGPVLEIDWCDDSSKLFIASADKTVRVWDLGSNQLATVGQHDLPVKTCHWIKSNMGNGMLMTTSWDKTIRFWDMRSPTAAHSITVADRIFCADAVYPMAVVGLANRQIIVYKLEGGIQEVKQTESPLKFQHRCISIFKKDGNPSGFALGSIEGRVAIQYVESSNPKDNFTFKCHRSAELVNGFQDIFAVNDVAFHPVHNTLATVGSDGRFSFWDKDARTKLKSGEQMTAPITRCCFNASGEAFAYAVGYDWSKGHEYYNPQAKNHIFIRNCFEEMKPRPKK